MLKKLNALWHPDRFQGWGITRRYFEGWYFKVVSADERHAISFIPGIAFSPSGESHAFIQLIDGKSCRMEYHRFASADFIPADDRMEVQVGINRFSDTGFDIQLPDIKGALSFQKITPWPKMLGAPGIMGWYSFVPFMECNHGIVSMNHKLTGTLNIWGETVDFTGGKGYIEKDWGHSFPRAYVWMQSNHFQSSHDASLMASVAHIPWLGQYFPGFISGFWLDGQLHKFATYTGASYRLELGEEVVRIYFKDRKKELRIEGRQGAGVTLVSPAQGEMRGKINESLQATLAVEFLINGKRVFEDTGKNGGLEVVGDVRRWLI
jgi:tocopherol cyclase